MGFLQQTCLRKEYSLRKQLFFAFGLSSFLAIGASASLRVF